MGTTRGPILGRFPPNVAERLWRGAKNTGNPETERTK